MSVVKVKKRENPYIQIDKTGIHDSNLSWKATGLLTYLVGRPDDWKVVLEHLAKCKTDGMTSCKSALRELRLYNYCHYFELRKNGRIVETFYMIYEIPTPYSDELKEEVLSSIEDSDNSYTLIYKKVDESKSENKTTFEEIEDKKSLEKRSVLPKVENPLAVNPLAVNPLAVKPLAEKSLLLKKDYTNKRLSKERSTTKERKAVEETENIQIPRKEKNSSSYDFLNSSKYSLLNPATKINIQNKFDDLTEEEFDEMYNLTLEYFNSGRGKDFNAILFKGLKGEWYFTPVKAAEVKENKEVEENAEEIMLKRKWLSYFAGIPKEEKTKIMETIKDIPLEVLNKNKSKLSRMTLFEFQVYLSSLKKRITA